jgi:hypothetical protein
MKNVSMGNVPDSFTLSDREGASRFGHLIERRDGVDFPYYNGVPVSLSVGQWILVWAAVAVGLAVIYFVPQVNNFEALIPRILLSVIPLAVLALVTRQYWTVIFRKLRPADFLLIIVFAALNLLIAFAMGLMVKAVFGAASDAAVASGFKNASVPDIIAFYVGTAVQIVGEEIFTILPFLALMFFFFAKARLPRKTTIILAWMISAVWFGLAHLPAYHWNLAQVLFVQGVSRLVLSLAFIRTKNLWVSFGTHLLYDWTTFMPTLIAALTGHA